MATNNNRWIFTDSQLSDTPSRRCGISPEDEANYRFQAATLIRDIGNKLSVTQLCINTAIVYMHRYYMFNSFSNMSYKSMAPACVFLAAKVEEQPRKMEHVIPVAYSILNRDLPGIEKNCEAYMQSAQDINSCETDLLMTLGFETTVEHPHTTIVRTCTMIKASRDFAQSSYFLASSSLLMTTMCLRYPTSVVACVCIHAACRWSSFEIPQSTEGKAWYTYIEPTVNPESLEEMTQQFCAALDRFPNKLKKKIIHNKLTPEDLGQQEKRTHFELPQNFNQRSKANSSATATASQASAGPSTQRKGDLVPVWNKEPVAAGTSIQVAKPSHLNSQEKAAVNCISAVSASESQLRRVKTEASITTTTTVSAKEYKRRTELKKAEEEQKKLMAETVKKESSRPDASGTGSRQLSELNQPVVVNPSDIVKLEPRENIFAKIQKDPKSEKKPVLPMSDGDCLSESQKTENKLDLDVILKPEHIHGSSHLKFSAATLPHKTAVNPHHQSVDQSQNSRQSGRTSLPSSLETSQVSAEPGHHRIKTKERSVNDQLAMGDAQARHETDLVANTTIKTERRSLESTLHPTPSTRLNVPDAMPLLAVNSSEPMRRHHKKSRSHHHSREDRHSAVETANLANAPLKLKIITPPPAQKSHLESGDLKYKIKNPAVEGVQHKANSGTPESTEIKKLKIKLAGPVGKHETVGSDERYMASGAYSSDPAPSTSHESHSSQVPSSKNNGGSTAPQGVKLVLSKDKISGEYQRGSSVHHEEPHHHRRRHRHHSKSETNRGDQSHKRPSSPDTHNKQKIPRLEAEGNFGNGSQGSANKFQNPYSVNYLGQNYPTSLTQQYTQHLVAAPYQVNPRCGVIQPPPPPPPPLPSEPAPLPPPPPPF